MHGLVRLHAIIDAQRYAFIIVKKPLNQVFAEGFTNREILGAAFAVEPGHVYGGFQADPGALGCAHKWVCLVKGLFKKSLLFFHKRLTVKHCI